MSFFSTLWADIVAAWTKMFGTSGANVTAAVAADIELIGKGLTGALTLFENLAGVSPATITTIQGYIGSIEAGALQVTTAIETNIAKPVVAQISADFSALESAVGPLMVGAPAALVNIMKAVTTLIPYIEAGVGLLVAGDMGAKAVQASIATGLSQSEAQDILRAQAGS